MDSTSTPAREFYATVSAYLPNRPQFRLEDAGGTEPGLQEALKVAAERNVTIFTIDSRGASAPAPGSGGEMDASSNGAGNGIPSVTGTRSRSSAPVNVRTGSLQTADRQTNPFASRDSATMEQLARATAASTSTAGATC